MPYASADDVLKDNNNPSHRSIFNREILWLDFFIKVQVWIKISA